MRRKLNKRFYINICIIVVFAVFSGYFVGNFYLSNFVSADIDVNVSESVVRDKMTDVFKRTANKSVSQISATDNFVLAEYYLNQRKSVRKTSTGKVTAQGITQDFYSQKILSENEFYYMKISSGLLSIATKMYWTVGSDTVNFYKGKNIKTTTATWSDTPSKTYTFDEYKEDFGIPAGGWLNYIVSSKTVITEGVPKKLGNGNYQFELHLDKIYSTMNYKYEVKQTSGSSKNPRFKSSVITFEIDENWNFIQIDYKEKYEVAVKQLGGMFVETVGTITDTFEYDGDFIIP